MPKKGSDPRKIKAIRLALMEAPKGIWIREIARRTNVSKSSVHIYINKYMQDEVEDVMQFKGSLIRLVRLKDGNKC